MSTRKTIEDSVAGFVSEAGKVFGEDAVAGALTGVARSLARTKASVDSNVESVLGLANLPAKTDIDRLSAKIDALQRSVTNLSRKLDRMEKAAVAPDRAPELAPDPAAEVLAATGPKTTRKSPTG
ncbi:MAG: hypothetical protein ACI91F_002976 [Candidatus Binatia bacterium]